MKSEKTAEELCRALARADGWAFSILTQVNAPDGEHWHEAMLSRQQRRRVILAGKTMPTVEEACGDLLKLCASEHLLGSHSTEELIFKVEVMSQ